MTMNNTEKQIMEKGFTTNNIMAFLSFFQTNIEKKITSMNNKLDGKLSVINEKMESMNKKIGNGERKDAAIQYRME